MFAKVIRDLIKSKSFVGKFITNESALMAVIGAVAKRHAFVCGTERLRILVIARDAGSELRRVPKVLGICFQQLKEPCCEATPVRRFATYGFHPAHREPVER